MPAPAPKLCLLSSVAPSWSAQLLDVGRPYGAGYWSFNPSVTRDPTTGAWLCMVRCANYCIPGGVVMAPKNGPIYTRNVMLVLEPGTWKTLDAFPVFERDDTLRVPCHSRGFEDVRIFVVGDQVLGVACALQTNDRHPGYPEQVLLTFDKSWCVATSTPLRGSWSVRPQKNWVPFDGHDRVRLLYSIDEAIVLSDEGQQRRGILAPIEGSPIPGVPVRAVAKNPPRAASGVEVRLTTQPRPMARAQEQARPSVPGSTNLRGGSQLVKIDEPREARGEVWLGIGHEVRVQDGAKLYWHVWYTCDRNGRTLARSAPFKLVEAGIEFAAGLALDGSAAVVTFGVDDHDAMIGTVELGEIEAMLEPKKDEPREARGGVPTWRA